MNPNIIKLVSGSNAKLDEASTQATVKISCSSSPAILDISCFMVGGNGKVPSDDFFIFYNQPADPKHTVVFNPIDKCSGEFAIDLRALRDSAIEKCVFAATLDGPGTFADVRGCRISAAGKGTELVYEIMDGNAETSLVLAELYRHGGGFKLRAVGRGFHGGLKPLAEAHGVEVEDEAPENSRAQPHAQGVPGHMEAAATYSGPPKDTVQEEAPRPALNLTKIDLLKQQVGISLRKKNLDQEKARVAVVFDASGSMAQLYAKGVVQRALNGCWLWLPSWMMTECWMSGSSPPRAKECRA